MNRGRFPGRGFGRGGQPFGNRFLRFQRNDQQAVRPRQRGPVPLMQRNPKPAVNEKQNNQQNQKKTDIPANATSAVAPAAPTDPKATAKPTNELAKVESNHVELVVANKTLTEYAEFVEKKLKNMGLIVDLLYPNEGTPTESVLVSIANRGTLFAIIIGLKHEPTRSVTLLILYGTPQEHRNVLLDDAMSLLSRNIQCYKRGHMQPLPAFACGKPVNLAGNPLVKDHPSDINELLQLLLESKDLKLDQMNQMIAYLDGMKEAGEMGIPFNPPEPDPQAKLQHRILSLMKT